MQWPVKTFRVLNSLIFTVHAEKCTLRCVVITITETVKSKVQDQILA